MNIKSMDTLRQNLLFYFKSFILFYLDLFYHMEKTVDACSFSTSEGAVVCTGKLSSQSLSHYTHTHTHLESLGLLYLPATYISQLSAYYSYAAFAFSIHIHRHNTCMSACTCIHTEKESRSHSSILCTCVL